MQRTADFSCGAASTSGRSVLTLLHGRGGRTSRILLLAPLRAPRGTRRQRQQQLRQRQQRLVGVVASASAAAAAGLPQSGEGSGSCSSGGGGGSIAESWKDQTIRRFRVIYTQESWTRHRSRGRYLRHILGLFRSRIVAALSIPLLLIALESAAVVAYERALVAGGILPGWCVSLALQQPTAFNLSSAALSLLLVFRTNASYGRFDEARKLFGAGINACRDLARQGAVFFGDAQGGQLRSLGRWLAAFPWVLASHLRAEKTMEADLRGILTPAELAVLAASPNAPLTCILAISQAAERVRALPVQQRLGMDENVTALVAALGGCERIVSTPIPVSYTRHTTRFLTLWLAFLPFALVGACGLATVPAAVAIAFALLAIEEIGIDLEEPFFVLPLRELSAVVSANVQQIIGEYTAVVQVTAEGVGRDVSGEALPPQQLAAAAVGALPSDASAAAAAAAAAATDTHGDGSLSTLMPRAQ